MKKASEKKLSHFVTHTAHKVICCEVANNLYADATGIDQFGCLDELWSAALYMSQQ